MSWLWFKSVDCRGGLKYTDVGAYLITMTFSIGILSQAVSVWYKQLET